MSIICSICARKGSKGLRNKNIKLLNKKPLIYYTIQQAIKSKLFDYIAFSTDSDKIAQLALKYGVDYCIKRPKNYSKDNSNKIVAIKHLLLNSEKYFKKKFETIIDLDVTSPLRKISDIINAYKKFKKKNADNLITACKSRKNPYFNIIEKKNNKYKLVKKSFKIFDSRQEAPEVYDMNASIYIWKRNVLLKNKSLFNKKTSMYLMPINRSFDIDTKEDWDLVKYFFKSRKVYEKL